MKKLVFVIIILTGLTGIIIWNDQVDVSIPETLIEKQNTPSPSLSAKASSTPLMSVTYDVPFLSQAPLGGWSDPRQQDGCEEASVLMAAHWVRGEKITSAQAGLEKLLLLSKFGEEEYGTFHDTSIEVTAKFFQDYYQIDSAKVEYDITVNDIVNALRDGKIVIVPTNGQLLGNPNFTSPGPVYHMLVVIGFNQTKKIFITNDPGTRNGAKYQYSYDRLYNAISGYETGQHIPRIGDPKVMIAVSR